jgi:hypothetical protein
MRANRTTDCLARFFMIDPPDRFLPAGRHDQAGTLDFDGIPYATGPSDAAMRSAVTGSKNDL